MRCARSCPPDDCAGMIYCLGYRKYAICLRPPLTVAESYAQGAANFQAIELRCHIIYRPQGAFPLRLVGHFQVRRLRETLLKASRSELHLPAYMTSPRSGRWMPAAERASQRRVRRGRRRDGEVNAISEAERPWRHRENGAVPGVKHQMCRDRIPGPCSSRHLSMSDDQDA